QRCKRRGRETEPPQREHNNADWLDEVAPGLWRSPLDLDQRAGWAATVKGRRTSFLPARVRRRPQLPGPSATRRAERLLILGRRFRFHVVQQPGPGFARRPFVRVHRRSGLRSLAMAAALQPAIASAYPKPP